MCSLLWVLGSVGLIGRLPVKVAGISVFSLFRGVGLWQGDSR